MFHWISMQGNALVRWGTLCKVHAAYIKIVNRWSPLRLGMQTEQQAATYKWTSMKRSRTIQICDVSAVMPATLQMRRVARLFWHD